VRGDTVLGRAVHGLGADLQLDRLGRPDRSPSVCNDWYMLNFGIAM